MDNQMIKKFSLWGVVLLFAIIFVGSALSYRSDCVSFEAKIPAQWKQNENNYDQMWKKFKETAQGTV